MNFLNGIFRLFFSSCTVIFSMWARPIRVFVSLNFCLVLKNINGEEYVNRWTDRGLPFCFVALDLIPKNCCITTLPKNLFYKILYLPARKLESIAFLVSHQWFSDDSVTF